MWTNSVGQSYMPVQWVLVSEVNNQLQQEHFACSRLTGMCRLETSNRSLDDFIQHYE